MKIRIGILLLALMTLAACGSSDGGQSVPDDQAINPAAGDSGWVTTDVNGVEISVPSELEKTGPISPGDGAQLFTFQTAENDFGTRGGVQLVTLPKRKKSAEDLVGTITSQAEATIGAKKVTSEQVKWPGAKDAWFVTYVAQVPKNGKTAPHPTEVLVVDLPDGGQSQATVTALKDDFESQRMHEVLQTLKITDKVGAKQS